MFLRRLAALVALAALAGCAPPQPAAVVTPSPTVPVVLTPFQTPTLTPSPSGPPPTRTPIPTATATPVVYTIKKGDDMFGIALRYGIPIEALKTANPKIDPNWLSIGQTLTIPLTVTPTPVGTPDRAAATPEPAAVALGEPACYPSADGGAWCIVAAHNTGAQPLESVVVPLSLAGEGGAEPVVQKAFALLDVLPPGESLPLVAYFPDGASRSPTAEAGTVTALPQAAGDRRYLEASLEGLTTHVAGDGLSAGVSGSVRLMDPSAAPGLVWVAATAYDTAGRPVGVRKWEKAPQGTFGAELPFEMTVYSLGSAIARVDVQVEAHK